MLVKVGHVRDQVLDNVHVGKWVDARLLGGLGGNAACSRALAEMPQVYASCTYKDKPVC